MEVQFVRHFVPRRSSQPTVCLQSAGKGNGKILYINQVQRASLIGNEPYAEYYAYQVAEAMG